MSSVTRKALSTSFVLAAVLFALPVGLVSGHVNADTPAPPGEIKFIGKNKVATANGTFKAWRFSNVEHSDAAPGVSSVEIEVDVASIDTGIAARDNHLRNDEFFDVEKFPKATLKIYDIAPKSGTTDTYAAKLDFGMHGVKKTYANFEFKASGGKVSGKFAINRMDFKIGKPKSINPMSIVEEIPITFSATIPEKG